MGERDLEWRGHEPRPGTSEVCTVLFFQHLPHAGSRVLGMAYNNLKPSGHAERSKPSSCAQNDIQEYLFNADVRY